MHPQPEFLSLSTFPPYFLLKPTQKEIKNSRKIHHFFKRGSLSTKNIQHVPFFVRRSLTALLTLTKRALLLASEKA
jgi:hypothetical protein